LKSIEYNLFGACRSLKSITIPNSVKSIGSEAFAGCSSLTSITIPNSVTSIEEKAFLECSSLKSITIPNGVKSIKPYTFQECISLTSVTIPNSVKVIDRDAFCDCRSLTSITIPSSVTSIGYYAFENCEKLQKVISKIVNPFKIDESVFDDIRNSKNTYSRATLYVPKGTVAKYKATESWKQFFNIVEEGTKTGIDDIKAVEADNTTDTSKRIYDINGKRLPVTSLDQLPSGLYIINGKKVVK
jgi:hypothetical protein